MKSRSSEKMQIAKKDGSKTCRTDDHYSLLTIHFSFPRGIIWI